MTRTIAQYITHHHLLQAGDKVLVALSGGADSVALLHILTHLGYECQAAHCNFHLRGEESNRDENFVRALCETWGVTLHIKHFDTIRFADENGISIEMAARELRYQWFEALRIEHQLHAIAVGHHQNDQAETVLLNLQRGTGLRGLEGMHAKNGAIIRPLLATSRDFIEDYCTLNHLEYVIDSTNNNPIYQRNAIRQQLQAYSPAQVAHIAQTAERMQGYEAIINTYIEQQKSLLVQTTAQGIEIDIVGLLALPAAETVLYELLREYGFKTTQQIFAALSTQAGKQFRSDTHQAEIGREKIYIFPMKSQDTIVPTVVLEEASKPTIFPSADAHEIYVDGSVAEKHITIRRWKEGDWFIPLGMRGKKKLQDFFTDMKLSRHEKDNIWLLCADDDIVWVIGYRIDDRYKITAQTKTFTHISVQL